MVRVVQSRKELLMVFCIRASISGSMAAVASSTIRTCRSREEHQVTDTWRGAKGVWPLTLHLLSRALATHSSCLSPTEKFSPFSTTSESNLRGSWDTWWWRQEEVGQVDRCAAPQGVDGGTHTFLHVAPLQSVPDLLFTVLEKRVQVGPANRNLPQFLQSFVLT